MLFLRGFVQTENSRLYDVKNAKCAINPIQVQAGGVPCCAETVCSRLKKLSDFGFNYIGHHLK